MDKIKIVIADDHAVLRAGLKLMLNAEPTWKSWAEDCMYLTQSRSRNY